MRKEIGPHEAAHERTSDTKNNNNEEKWRRILKLLVTGARFNRFDVEKFGDHCFNTSVSVIGKKGIRISREPITLQGRFGTIYCKRYWLEPDECQRALQLLGESP